MNNKVVVFDLDETLGYFTQVGVLFDTIELYTNAAMEFDTFCKIFDLYSEIFRVNIFSILKYLKRVKRMKHLKVMLYTNNQADKSWGTNIIKYIEHKISSNLFDHLIHAYKIGNKQIESCRTSHDKKYSDLIECANLPADSKICFIDDQYHRHMKHKNVYYINVRPYNFKFNDYIFFSRFFESEVFNELVNRYKIKNPEQFKVFIQNHFKNINFGVERDADEMKSDKILSKKIMYHVQKFITRRNVTKKNTPKRKTKSTRKKRKN